MSPEELRARFQRLHGEDRESRAWWLAILHVIRTQERRARQQAEDAATRALELAEAAHRWSDLASLAIVGLQAENRNQSRRVMSSKVRLFYGSSETPTVWTESEENVTDSTPW